MLHDKSQKNFSHHGYPQFESLKQSNRSSHAHLRPHHEEAPLQPNRNSQNTFLPPQQPLSTHSIDDQSTDAYLVFLKAKNEYHRRSNFQKSPSFETIEFRKSKQQTDSDRTGNSDNHLFITKLNRQHQATVSSGVNQKVETECSHPVRKSRCASSAATSSNDVKFMVLGRQDRILSEELNQESQLMMAPPQSDCQVKVENGSSNLEYSFQQSEMWKKLTSNLPSAIPSGLSSIKRGAFNFDYGSMSDLLMSHNGA